MSSDVFSSSNPLFATSRQKKSGARVVTTPTRFMLFLRSHQARLTIKLQLVISGIVLNTGEIQHYELLNTNVVVRLH